MTLYIGNKNITERIFLDYRQNSLPSTEFNQYLSKSLTSFVAPNSIVKLRNYCFNGFTSLTSVKISTSIKELGENCFKGCSGLTKVWLPLSCIRIASNAFDGVPSTCKIYTDSLMDVKTWESGWNGNATVLYDKSETDFNNG